MICTRQALTDRFRVMGLEQKGYVNSLAAREQANIFNPHLLVSNKELNTLVL